MDLLKKFWPHAFKANDVAGLVITVIIYLLVDIVLGWLIGILVKIPIIGIIFTLIGSLLGLYCLVGIVLAFLYFFKILK